MIRHFTSLTDPELPELLKSGAVGVIPTDTVYGLVACAKSQSGIERLYHVKPRERAPGTMIGASIDDFAALGFSPRQLEIVARYWPAALSVVLDATSVAPYLRQDRQDLPIRIPAKPELIALLEQTGPLMTTSANAPGEATATTIDMAHEYFGATVDFYVDGGDLFGQPPSTIVGIESDGSIVVHRHGAADISL